MAYSIYSDVSPIATPEPLRLCGHSAGKALEVIELILPSSAS